MYIKYAALLTCKISSKPYASWWHTISQSYSLLLLLGVLCYYYCYYYYHDHHHHHHRDLYIYIYHYVHSSAKVDTISNVCIYNNMFLWGFGVVRCHFILCYLFNNLYLDAVATFIFQCVFSCRLRPFSYYFIYHH